MGCLCLSKSVSNRSRAHDSPAKHISALPSGSRDENQSSSIALPRHAKIATAPSQNDAPVAISITQPDPPKTEGLSQLRAPIAEVATGKTYDLDVVAIHGLNGHPRDTWTYNTSEGQIFWLQDFLPKALPGARIFTFGYDSRLFFSSSTGDIGTYAKALLDYLNIERQQLTPQRSRPIVFICHSLGGLVCKKSLVIANEKRDRYKSILDSTKAIFFFGTPHQGSDFADTVLLASPILKLFDSGLVEFLGGRGKLVRRDLLKELSAKSKMLDDLCSAFVGRAHRVPSITSFFEMNEIRGSVIVSKRSSSMGLNNENVVPLAGDHLQICRIKDEKDIAYQTIVQICQELGTNMSERNRPLNPNEQQCLDSLALSNFADILGPRMPPAKDTCEWILSVQQFHTWRNGVLPLLWISAELGCGKTTLLSFLRYQVLEHERIADDSGNNFVNTSMICGFFCDDRNSHLANATVLLQALLWDIVSQRHDLIHHVLKHYQISRKWSYMQLWRMFEAVLDDPQIGGVCIIIDALDECDRKERATLLRDLAEYLERRPKTAHSPIRFVISSRPTTNGIPKLEAHSSYLMVEEDAVLREYMAADIRRFVLDDLQCDGQFFSKDDPERSIKLETLVNMIASKSEGSFLWASLVLEDLHARSYIELRDVENFISECPPDFYGMYYASLANVRPCYRKDVSKSLQIILAAKRPLQIAEFKAAMAVERRHQTLKELQQTVDNNLGHLIPYLRDQLGKLIRIDDSKVTLRHHAVKDFLLNKLSGMQQSPHKTALEHSSNWCDTLRMRMKEADRVLAECCIGFLDMEDFRKKRSSEEVYVEAWKDSGFGAMFSEPATTAESSNPISHEYDYGYSDFQIPFLEYAASNWGFHYASSDSADEELMSAALKLSTRPDTLANWSHHYRRSYRGFDNLPESLDALIVAAYFGHIAICKKLTSNNDFKSNWTRALTWASRMGHSDIVKLLIRPGTQCMGEMLDGRSAFSWAAAGGFLEVVDMLLACDEQLANVKDIDGCCPLILATENEHMEVIERLLGLANIDVNARSFHGRTLIHYAIGGHAPSATELSISQKLFCDLRVDITVRDNRGRSFLSYAAEYGATKSIQALLDFRERRDDVETLLDDGGDNEGLSPLSYAAWMGHSSVIRLLCKTNKINSQLQSVDKLDGANVFDLAAKRGHVEVIRELGQLYPEGRNSRDLSGRTPLSTAMWGTSANTLRALLDCGADVNLPDFEGRTPISYGIGKIELVRVLVKEGGADINLPDKDGHTPLWEARNMDGSLQAQLRDLGAHL